MRLTFDVRGLDQATRNLTEAFSVRRMNAAVATAMTYTALDIREEVKREMRAVFDRPTPYTMGSLFVRPATADRLFADVFFKDDSAGSGTPATKYLLPEVEGGPRRQKRFERALELAGHLPKGWMVVPGRGARLDAYGNVSKGQIIQVLSQLRITLTAGFTRNMSFEARKQITAQRKAGGRFFVAKPGAKNLTPGVYQRDFYSEVVTPIFIFVKGASYRRRLDFYGIANRIARERMPVHVGRAIAASAQRLAARGT